MPNVRRTKASNNVAQGVGEVRAKSRSVSQGANARRRREQRHSGVTLDLERVDAEALRDALVSVLSRGVGITFGITRDGAALSITLLDNGENVREYVRPTDDIDEYFRGLAEDFREIE